MSTAWPRAPAAGDSPKYSLPKKWLFPIGSFLEGCLLLEIFVWFIYWGGGPLFNIFPVGDTGAEAGGTGKKAMMKVKYLPSPQTYRKRKYKLILT